MGLMQLSPHLWGHNFSCYFPATSARAKFMPRKQSAVLSYKLRIREGLRRRLDQEAKKRGVSLNAEMAQRLERSFEQQEQVSVAVSASSLAAITARLDEMLHPLNQQGDLLRATKALIVSMDKFTENPGQDMRELAPRLPEIQAMTRALASPEIALRLAEVHRVMNMIESESQRLPERAHTIEVRPVELNKPTGSGQ